ncbi:adenylate cyclase type 10-like [Aphidius gifuensis]|uniref:adenylate cyclase type 10-like n=1 Tax=Aphidius gifuensis TaxID=684658 RepID=UPI001CDB8E2B|nr:adenylate cyclase type 10-like [Aphidius gifuensis]
MNEKRRRPSEITKIEKHTEIFASMCPDEILDFYNDYNTRDYYTTLMLGDVSGFTELAEKYTNSGEGGPSKLTETLNNYIGPMIQEILSHHGDVLKFSGDAFIVMWKLRDGIVMRDLATDAMQTACVIQKHFGTYETDVGVTLRVKLAIASGKIYFTSIGNPQTISHYIITGKPVWDIKAAEALCKGGDTLVLPSCWKWADLNDYVYKILPDGIHTLIIDSIISWDNPKEQYSDIDADSLQDTTPPKILSSILESKRQQDGNNYTYEIDQYQFTVDYSLRPKVIQVAKKHLKEDLKSYMLRPVMRSVELDEPLEHLTEIRQVVIVFINIVTNSIGKKRMIDLIDSAYKLICSIVSGMQGCVNKTSLFDKDLMFLCIFGLRGDKHDFEAQIGLRCAAKLQRELNKLNNIKSISIGVTTGMTYCGVVGHILRREYTVIGMAVNKAARLMIAYKNKVICDKDTFLHSRFEATHFTLQEQKYLKGITNVGPIYEFIEYTKGEPRIGKTRLLDEISLQIPKELACNYINLVSNYTDVPFALIYLIFSAPLDFTTISTSKNREEKLNYYLKDSYNEKFFCALNPVFNVNFNNDPEYTQLSKNIKYKIKKQLIVLLMRKCFKDLWIIIVDNIDNSDKESLILIDAIVQQDHVYFVLSCGKKCIFDNHNHSNIIKKSKLIELVGLDKWFHAGLICQILNVTAIPAELEKVIQEKSMGNPGWIESYLISLIQIGGIVLKQVMKNKLKEMGLVVPTIITDTQELKNLISNDDCDGTDERSDGWKMYKTSYGESTPTLKHSKKSLPSIDSNISNDKITVCTIPRGSSLEEINPEIAMDVIIIKLFDSLSPLDQFLLKCAAVLGEIVNRKMLEKLMEGTPTRDIALSVRNLFEMRIIGCAAGDFSQNKDTLTIYRGAKTLNGEIKIRCACMGLEILEIVSDLPKYASCGLLIFKVETFRETTYRLLTEYQKIELHRTALKYLKRNTKRCESCGGGSFTILLGKFSNETPRTTRIFNENDDTILSNQIPNTFSNIDFNNCHCNLILITAYTQILDHCWGIDRKDKALTAILEFVEILLTTSNIPLATKLLIDAEKILNQLYKTDIEELVTYLYLKGKIKTLEGKCHLHCGLIDESLAQLTEAIQILGYKFPKYKTDDDDDAANYNDQLAKILILMFDIFQIKRMTNHARFAAVWALNAALKSCKDFSTLCYAYGNMITSAHNNQYHDIIRHLEKDGLKLCNKKKNDIIELHETKAIVHLYKNIFFSRFLRGNIEDAYSIGLISRKLSSNVKSITQEIIILARIIQLLIIKCQYSKVIELLKELRSLADVDIDKSGRTWYYAFCIDLQLEAGITILSFEKCEQYYLEEGNTMIDLLDPEAEKRYFTSMWLWCIRMNKWDAATIWKNRKTSITYPVNDLTVAASITVLKNLEGHIIYYVCRVYNQFKKKPMKSILDVIQQDFKLINKRKHILKITLARFVNIYSLIN